MIRERGKEEIVAFGTTVRLLLEPKPVRGSTMKGTSEMSSFFFFFFFKKESSTQGAGLVSRCAQAHLHRSRSPCGRSMQEEWDELKAPVPAPSALEGRRSCPSFNRKDGDLIP